MCVRRFQNKKGLTYRIHLVAKPKNNFNAPHLTPQKSATLNRLGEKDFITSSGNNKFESERRIQAGGAKGLECRGCFVWKSKYTWSLSMPLLTPLRLGGSSDPLLKEANYFQYLPHSREARSSRGQACETFLQRLPSLPSPALSSFLPLYPHSLSCLISHCSDVFGIYLFHYSGEYSLCNLF